MKLTRERHKLSKLKQKEIENMNRPTANKKTELVIKKMVHRDAWLALSVECVTLDLGVVSSSPTLGSTWWLKTKMFLNISQSKAQSHPKAIEHTFFSSVHGTFSRVNCMLGHKTSLHIFKKIEIMSKMFSGHSGMKRNRLRENSQICGN